MLLPSFEKHQHLQKLLVFSSKMCLDTLTCITNIHYFSVTAPTASHKKTTFRCHCNATYIYRWIYGLCQHYKMTMSIQTPADNMDMQTVVWATQVSNTSITTMYRQNNITKSLSNISFQHTHRSTSTSTLRWSNNGCFPLLHEEKLMREGSAGSGSEEKILYQAMKRTPHTYCPLTGRTVTPFHYFLYNTPDLALFPFLNPAQPHNLRTKLCT